MTTKTINIPKSLKYLIQSNNEKLKTYQDELMDQLHDASIEIMELLNLDPKDGWRLDLESMQFVNVNSKKSDEPID